MGCQMKIASIAFALFTLLIGTLSAKEPLAKFVVVETAKEFRPPKIVVQYDAKGGRL